MIIFIIDSCTTDAYHTHLQQVHRVEDDDEGEEELKNHE